MNTKIRRWSVAAATAVLAVAVAGLGALHFAAHVLKTRIELALGSDSEVAAVKVAWSAVEVTGVVVRGPKGWPAADALRADRIVVVPDIRTLLSGNVRVDRITVHGAYVSALRARDGRLRIVPSLTEGATGTSPGGVTINRIEVQDAVFELYDATVAQRPHRLRLEALHGTVEHLALPQRSGRTRIDMTAAIRGPHRNGSVSLRGWLELANRDMDLATRLRGADLVLFSPYLLKASDIAVRRGTLDLELDASVRRNALRAPGRVTLGDIELASGAGSFMGLPRDAVLAALKDRNGRIVVQFTLEGDVSDPRFSLNESFTRRIASSLADTLGISVEGLARSLGDTARGIGDTVKKLLAP